jgi:hypothetical protein
VGRRGLVGGWIGWSSQLALKISISSSEINGKRTRSVRRSIPKSEHNKSDGHRPYNIKASALRSFAVQLAVLPNGSVSTAHEADISPSVA